MIRFLLIMISCSSFAAETSLRALCRQRVAGIHLNYLDDEETISPRILNLKKKNDVIAEQIKKNEKELQSMKRKVDENPTEMKNRDLAQGISARLDSLRVMLTENQKYLTSEENRKKSAQNKLDDFRKKLPPTFKVTKEMRTDAKGYAWSIDYTKGCPRFRQGCALTPVEKESLRKIFIGQEMPDSCEKYLSITDIKDPE